MWRAGCTAMRPISALCARHSTARTCARRSARTGRWRFCRTHGHRLAREKRFPIRQAAHEPFVSLPESSAQDTRMALEAAGVKPNIKFYTRDGYAAIAMAANGPGRSIVPALLLAGRSNGLAVRELDIPGSRTIGPAMRALDGVGAATVRFADHACAWIHAHAGNPLCGGAFRRPETEWGAVALKPAQRAAVFPQKDCSEPLHGLAAGLALPAEKTTARPRPTSAPPSRATGHGDAAESAAAGGWRRRRTGPGPDSRPR